MPEHPVLTRRQQFKIKSSIKEDKKSKKGKGKGKGKSRGKGKGKGKSRGKGKAKEKSRGKGAKEKMKRKQLSSKRAILLNKRKSATKRRKQKGSSKPNTSVESPEPEKITETKEAQVDVAALEECPKHDRKPDLKKPRKGAHAGQTSKNKAESRAQASNKKTKKQKKQDKNNAKATQRSNKKRKDDEKHDSCKTTSKSKGKGRGKASKKDTGCTKDLKDVSDELLQGRFKISDIEVDEDLVCPAIKSYFTEIISECQGDPDCDGSVHDLVMPEWDGLHFDMYWKRPAVGIRVRSSLVASHAPQKADHNPKTATSIAYFSAGRCMGTNIAMAKIFAS